MNDPTTCGRGDWEPISCIGRPEIGIAEVIAGSTGVFLAEELAGLLTEAAGILATTILPEVTACVVLAGWETSDFGL